MSLLITIVLSSASGIWVAPIKFNSFSGDFSFSFFLKKIFYLFRERKGGREGEREGNINVLLLLARPLLGTWPTTQACTLTGNPTSNPLIHRLTLIH